MLVDFGMAWLEEPERFTRNSSEHTEGSAPASACAPQESE
jgi:hypothetical protein